MKTKEIQWLFKHQAEARELLKLDSLAQLIQQKLHLKDADFSVELKEEVETNNPSVKTDDKCSFMINCKTNLVDQFGVAKWCILDVRLFTEINELQYFREAKCYTGFIFLDLLIAAVGGYSHVVSLGICHFNGEEWGLMNFKKRNQNVLQGANEGFLRDPSAKRKTNS